MKKAEIDFDSAGIAAVAASGTAELGRIVPATATQHTVVTYSTEKVNPL